jgi:hypothetical protein
MLIEIPYVRERAVEYALRWALSRNPLFPDFAGIGGDCTNFVSQAILAGSCVMNDTLDFGWYYFSPTNRAPAWTGVQYFYDFITQKPDFARENGGEGPFGVEVPTTMVMPGDVVQLANEQGTFYHTLMVTGQDGDDFLVSAHTDDARNRPLSTYRYATARFLHIRGVRVLLDNDECYRQLLSGTAYRPLTCTSDGILLRPQGGTM